MYNKFMEQKEINVKVGNRVSVQGYRGTVTKVHKGTKKEWNGKEYANIPGTEYTDVEVHFDDDQDIARFGQYQDGYYGSYTVIG